MLLFDPEDDHQRESYWVTKKFAEEQVRWSWYKGFSAACGLMIIVVLIATWITA